MTAIATLMQFVQSLSFLEIWELLSYVVTVIGLPLAIYTYMQERRKERENEEDEIYQELMTSYTNFLVLAMENSDLQLLHKSHHDKPLDDEQKERKYALFEILVSLFERAYIVAYAENMDKQARRRWKSWEDYMREWCRRPDFRKDLSELLSGEDEDFSAYIQSLAAEEERLLSKK
ncbi:hypothetical protein QPK87_08520 [Kamptonema cortianum]|nr:hypothetical protein [Oscillatoria laete-virens]MDK3156621.1 hypothetical protein [Kamptonema cortianum]MDL5050369.1 hypothetical protein [Oscillatoria amoena NRMC-F 0135]MDL5054234.1 hypothetical protein [Oscillatoria laete-virens NRMC-F 0139]